MRVNICVVIPCYNHSEKLKEIITNISTRKLDIILVDDASSTEHARVIDQLNSEVVKLILVRHKENKGKGGAVKSGLIHAKKLGFTHALQIDADGQHNLGDMDAFISEAYAKPKSLISGRPIYNDTIPKSRLYGREITHFWVRVETLSNKVVDTMCGYRVYPLEETVALAQEVTLGDRMDFDIEVMVRLAWRNVDIHFIPTLVTYPPDGSSHFKPLHDNLIISWMHTRLFFGMLIRLPKLLWQRSKA